MAKNQSLYAKLASQLAKEINNGGYPVGSYLPTENELVEIHKVSRATARSALNQLVMLGLVSRHKGVGTRVTADRPSRGYNTSAITIEDLVNYDAATIREVIAVDRVVADEVLAAKLDGRPGRRWALSTFLRYDPANRDAPVCHTDNYINEAFDSVAETISGYSGLIAHKINEEYGVSVDEVHQCIRAIGLSEVLANRLNCQPGDYALEITRHYYDINRMLMLVAIAVHPSDRFIYTSSIRHRKDSEL